MNQVLDTRSGRLGLLLGAGGMFMIFAAAAFGYWLGVGNQNRFPSIPLNQASTAAAGSNMAIATGQVSDDAEGVFFLDFVTGDLQCLVYYPRLGMFGARYYTNVQAQLPGAGRNAQYLMVTGNAIAGRGSSNVRPANCLVYITDVTSGLFAAYAVPWNKTAESSSQAQGGPLVFVAGGPIRNYQMQAAGGNAAGANAGANGAAAANGANGNVGNNGVNNNAVQNRAGGGNAAAGGNMQNNGNNAGLPNAAGANQPNPMPAGGGNAAGGNAAGLGNGGLGNGGLGNGGLGNGGLGNGGLGNGGLGNGGLGNGGKPKATDKKNDRNKNAGGKADDNN